MSSRLTLPTETQIKEILRLDSSRLPGFPRAAARLIKASREEAVSMKWGPGSVICGNCPKI